MGTVVGVLIILGTLTMGYFAFRKFIPQTAAPAPHGSTLSNDRVEPSKEEPLELAVEKMKIAMQQNPPDSDVATVPMASEQVFTAQTLAAGTFENINYMTQGGAQLQKQGDKYFVVFDESFATPNGPDLQVYLTKNTAPTQRNNIKEGIALGKLKSLKGKQVYAIPPGTNIDDYHSVSIHCRAFNVPWSYAALK